jgi:aldose sugar dehydrogenase
MVRISSQRSSFSLPKSLDVCHNNIAFSGVIKGSSLINRVRFAYILPAMGGLLLLFSHGGTAERGSFSSSASGERRFSSTTKPAASRVISKLPLSFEPNLAASKSKINFISRRNNQVLLLSASEATFVLRNVESAPSSSGGKSHARNLLENRLRLRLLGANTKAVAQGVDELPERRNYFIGNDPAKWRTDVPTFRAVRYGGVYRGVNLTYYGNQQQLEYDFEIAPGADPRKIRLAFDRAAAPRISATGDLVVRTLVGEIRQQRPVIYQEIDGQRRLVNGRFALLGKRQIGFDIDSYDRGKPLVIDPTLVFSTYLGGSGDDVGSSIAVDSSNNIYIAGTTSSINFPVSGAVFSANAGLADIFVTKIDATGANIVYSTYVGGSGLDRADGIALDNSGNAYVVGRVDSSSINFPTTPGAFATSYRGGDFDGVVFKLNALGNALVYSTYLGGEENDSTEGVAVDSNGNAYVTGGTKSIGFPTSVNAYQGTRAGDTDAFLTKINSAGSGLLYSTYLGGSGTDRGSGVAIDANGNAYLAGFTGSADFPTENAFQNGFGGSFDAFVAKIDTNASGLDSLKLCSYLGGIADDKAYGIAVDNAAANVYVVGQTSSNNFPLLNPAQAAFGGSFDAFIARITSSGNRVYATYLGGSGDDRGTGIAVNSSGAVYVTGFTSSANFPTVNPLQATLGGGFDAFVAKLNSAGSAFTYSTYLGGSGNENNVSTVTATNPIALDSSGNAYITGFTSSTNFPTVAPLQAGNRGGASDAFVAKISDASPAADFSVTASPSTRTVNPADSTTYNITVTPAGGFTGNVSLSVSGLSSDAGASFNPPSLMINDTTAKIAVLTVTTTASTPPGTYSLSVTATSGNLQHSASVSLVVAGPASANLSVVKTASPNPAIATANLTYRIVVTNNGPSPATNATITDPLPAGVNFVSASATQGMCSGTTTVTCNFGNLAKGASATANIVVLPQATGQLTNTATVAANETDPDTSDNSSTIATNVITQSSGPSMLDPNLSVKTVITGLSQPTSMAFIGPNDFFVLEKDTGKVRRFVNGTVQSTVLDLAVNSASERGLLGIALHPDFNINGFVYLYWTESSTGVDSTNLADVPLLGNRVDRYIWNGSTLTFDRNLIKLRAYQADANQPLRGNHNGGVLRFGPDGKLYILMGDNGRRGALQNLPCGPTSVCPGPIVQDDQFGGPDPDNAHLTGFILRLNDDGSTPLDNPFYNTQTNFTGEAAANIKKLFAYGVRNGFGLGFDPYSGNLWDQENGDDAFDEMNRLTAGANDGWVQIMGPVSRIAQYKQIETTYGAGNLQQLRWSPSLIADTPQDALARLLLLPGAHYNDPEFSWKYAIPAAPLGFQQGRGLGPQFEGDMFVGAARTFLDGGFLFRFKLTPDRLHFSFTDPRLNDLVADNLDKFDITESESLLIGKDFGITTDIETGPNGDLFVVSNTNGAVYELSGKQPTVFVANLNGAQETPPNSSTATGTATVLLGPDETTARVSLNFSGLSNAQTAAHIHGPGAPGVSAPILFPLPNGNVSDFLIALTPANVQDLKNGLLYINVHSNNFPNGEIRGQLQTSSSASSFQFSTASYMVTEGAGGGTITVTRLGDTSAAARVDYATSDGTASQRTDYTTISGTLRFAAGETMKTFTVPIVDDAYVEGNKTINLTLNNPTGGVYLGSPSTAVLTITDNDSAPPTTNPLDDAQSFVNQHYLDFLNREPDLGGLAYWTNEITKCGSNVACTNDRRISVSAAFFVENEFQQTGSFVYRLYKGALGRQPNYTEFSVDRSKVIGGSDLAADKTALLNEFVQRAEFKQIYPDSLTNAQFVNKLFDTAGLTPFTSERQQQIDAMNAGKTRSQVVGDVIEIQAFKDREYNPSFVLMQYYGYLRRDADPSGYAFWLDILNNRQPNNYRGMVCAFITSAEYQLRFSSVITHTNSECTGVR